VIPVLSAVSGNCPVGRYTSIRYTERQAEVGIEPSVGSVGDSYDNALAETISGLYKAEVIHRRRNSNYRASEISAAVHLRLQSLAFLRVSLFAYTSVWSLAFGRDQFSPAEPRTTTAVLEFVTDGVAFW